LLDLVEDHEPAEVREREHRLVKAGEIAAIFEIEERGRSGAPPNEFAGEGCLAHLPGAEERHHWALSEQPSQVGQVFSPVDRFHDLKYEAICFRFQGKNFERRRSEIPFNTALALSLSAAGRPLLHPLDLHDRDVVLLVLLFTGFLGWNWPPAKGCG
jgi:hypothetical protein